MQYSDRNQSFKAAVQQISVQCAIVNEVQNITTETAIVQESQLVYIKTSFLPTDSAVAEVQSVMCDAIGGSFRLSLNGYQTNSIPFDATAATIKTALQELEVIDTVTVAFSGGATQACFPQASIPGAAFLVTFTSVVGIAGGVPLLGGTTNSLQGLRRITSSRITPGLAGLGGNFRLSYRGATTEAIDIATATAALITTRLVELDTLSVGGVVVTDYSPTLVNTQGRLWGVTFTDPALGGDVEALVVPDSYNLLTGSGVSVRVLTDGAALALNESTTAPASVRGNEVSGTFYLSLRGYSVGPIDFNVADTVLKTQLESLPNVGVVAVSRAGPTVLKEYVWTITFLSTPGYFPPGAGDIAQLTATSSLGGTNSTVRVSTVTDGSAPLSGSFSLAMTNGSSLQTTTNIPADSSASELETYLNQLSSVGGVSVSRSVLGNGYSWYVRYPPSPAFLSHF